MRLVCPCCGAIASLEAWQNDPAWRDFAVTQAKFPPLLQNRIAPYLGLFRRGKRGLLPTRAASLARDLLVLVESGSVQVRGEESRPASIAIWAAAMDETVDARPDRLKNHNYLRKVAWSLAEAGAAQAEKTAESLKANAREAPAIGKPAKCQGKDVAPLEERQAVTDMLKAFTKNFGK
ncbi:MAG: hypothetical protein ABFD97_12815 [Syntrophobacter sp.]